MHERHSKLSNIIFYILIIIDILLIGFSVTKPHNKISFQQDPLYILDTDWTYTKYNGETITVDLPASLEAGNDDSVSITHTLPICNLGISYLGILSTHQNIEAFVDDRLIYSRVKPNSKGLFDLPTTNIWDIIELPNDSEGKKITLIISSDYNNYVGKVSEVYAGTRTGLFLHIIQSSGLSMVISIVTLVFGVILLIVYHIIKRLLHYNKAMLHLSWFVILCSTWMLAESNLIQLFISNEYVISGILYLSLLTFPIPMILYITDIESFLYKKLLFQLVYIVFSITSFIIILQLFNVFDFLQSSILVHTEIFILSIIVLILLYLELFKNKNKSIKSFTIATTILFTFEAIELFTYRTRASNSGILFQVGFIIFIVMLLQDGLRTVSGIIKLSESATHYKFLATRDLLTNCKNRVAYHNDLELLDFERKITIFIADLNNLKLVNDKYGHLIGDEVLELSSQCLLNTFGRRVYRIGGDEFASIQYDLTPDMEAQLLKDFEQECIKTNLDSPYPISVSIGYASYDKNFDRTIYETINRADKDMYVRKEQMKKSR